eukprot:Tamp_21964.p2 GENE.Tamp_21964~~Tamp_21964.p2  ORF type:complete len:130 (+),score=1.61 Tamp_21964:402-791(+)
MIRALPHLTSALFAAAGDCALFELARRFFGRAVAWQALLCQVVSWSYCYCMARPLAVSLETCLTSTALALWPWEAPVDPPSLFSTGEGNRGGHMARRAAFVIASLSFAVRPSRSLLASVHLHPRPNPGP